MSETPNEPTISVNDKQYKVSDLNKTAMANLQHLRFAETEVKRIQMQLALVQTSVVAYKQALVQNLPDSKSAADGSAVSDAAPASETIA